MSLTPGSRLGIYEVVSALGAGCTVFLTNDRRLPAFTGLRILQLSSYLGKG